MSNINPTFPTDDMAVFHHGRCRTCGGYGEHFEFCQRLAGSWSCTCPSPLGCHVHGPQPREQATFCWCGRETWNTSGRCDDHLIEDSEQLILGTVA